MIRFNIALYNYQNRQIYIYQLEVLIQSIWDVYKEEAEIAVLYNRVYEKDINEIKIKFPNIILNEYKIKFSEPSKDNFFNTWATRKLILWYELLQSSNRKHQVFMDADTFLIKKIDKFFDNTFDIGYTHKTDKEEVLKKPINTAVVLINNSQKVSNYMRYWRDKALKLLRSKKPYGAGWGATDQQVLGETLGTRDFNKMKSIIKKKGIRFKGFPCKMLNNILHPSLEDQNLYIIHFKGSWRDILLEGTWEKTKLRKKDSNGIKLYNLWKKTFDEFKAF